MKSSRFWWIVLVPFLFFVVQLTTLKDYGISWDEPIHFYRGQAYLHYFLTGKTNFDPLPEVRSHLPKVVPESVYLSFGRQVVSTNEMRRSYYQNNGLAADFFIKEDVGHPPLNDILAALTNYIFYQKLGIMDDVEAHHLFNILSSTILVTVVAVFAYQKYGLLSGMLAGIIISLYPLFFSEAHFNIKDPPQTAFFALTIWAFWMSLKKFSWKWLLLSAIACGVSLGMKFNILFLPFILLPYLLLISKQLWERRKLIRRTYFLTLLLFPVVVLIILFVPWVYLWQDPINNLFKILFYYKEIGTNSLNEPFFRVLGFNLYPTIWILVTTPLLVTLCFLGGVFLSLPKIGKGDKTELLWLLWFLVPLARVTLPGTNIYGGVRQIMEFLPPMILLAIFFFNSLLLKLPKKAVFLKMFLVVLFILPQVWIIVKYHPNQNVYFNSLIGGLKGAKEKNIPYWGNSFGNAYWPLIEWLNSNAEPGAKVSLVQGTGLNVPRIWLREDLDYWNGHWTGFGRGGEYLVELVYNNPIRAYPFSLDYVDKLLTSIYEVKVDGVAIGKIWKNNLLYTKAEYQKSEVLSQNYKEEFKNGSLKISFADLSVVSRIEVRFPNTINCNLVSGSVLTSSDGINWILKEERIPTQQVSNVIMVVGGKLTYYFPADELMGLQINLDIPTNCQFFIPKTSVYTLK